MNIRSLARRSLHRAGLQRIHHPSFVDLLLHEEVATVIDVGANEGQYGIELREQGFDGRIISFEPVAAVFETLKAHADADRHWEAHPFGVGCEQRDLAISVSEKTVFSSFKALTEYSLDNFPGAQETRREVVPVIRLDDFLRDRGDVLENCFLKVDTQGFEREVLAGCGDLLTQFRGIQLELPLRELYADQMLWVPMIEWMGERGFSVAMVKENGFDRDLMRLLELDVLFWRG